jgi:hypothetical protein
VCPFSSQNNECDFNIGYANSTLSHAYKNDSWLGNPSLRSSFDVSENSALFLHSFRRGHWPTSSTCNTRYLNTLISLSLSWSSGILAAFAGSVTTWHVAPLVWTPTGSGWFSLTGPDVQADRARDDRGLEILSRSRDEKYWGLNFGSLHTPVWGRLSTKGNRPLGSLQEFHKITGTGDFLIPSLNWKHQNKKEPMVLWFENMTEMLDWTVLDGRTSNH